MQFLISLLVLLGIPAIHADGLHEVVISDDERVYTSDIGDERRAGGEYDSDLQTITIYKNGDLKDFLHELGHHVCIDRDLSGFGSGTSFVDLKKYGSEWRKQNEDCAATYAEFYRKGRCYTLESMRELAAESREAFEKCLIIRKWHFEDRRNSVFWLKQMS